MSYDTMCHDTSVKGLLRVADTQVMTSHHELNQMIMRLSNQIREYEELRDVKNAKGALIAVEIERAAQILLRASCQIKTMCTGVDRYGECS